MSLWNFSVLFHIVKVELQATPGTLVATLAYLADDTDGLEDYCIDLGQQRFDDVVLVFRYVKGSKWNENKYSGKDKSAIDNIDVSFGKCPGCVY